MALAPERERVPDLLKGVGVVLMILVHLVELFGTDALRTTPAGHVAMFLGGPPAAPTFLMVMGYFVARRPTTSARMLSRGLRLVAGGLLLNLALNANVLRSIHAGRFHLDPLAYVFGADILPLAGLSLMLIAILRPLLRGSVLAWSATALAVSALPWLVPAGVPPPSPSSADYVAAFVHSRATWSYFPLIPWFAYLAIGHALGLLRQRPMPASAPSVARGLGTAAVVGLTLSIGWASSITSALPRYYHHSTLFALWTVAFVLAWWMAATAVDRHFGQSRAIRTLALLGRRITVAYVVQWVIIGNVATVLFHTQTAGQVAFWFLAVLAVTTAVVALWDRWRASTHRRAGAGGGPSPAAA